MRVAARWAASVTCRRRCLPPPPATALTDALYFPVQDALPSPDRLLTDRGSYIAYLEVRASLLPAMLPHARRRSIAMPLLQPTRRTDGLTLEILPIQHPHLPHLTEPAGARVGGLPDRHLL